MKNFLPSIPFLLFISIVLIYPVSILVISGMGAVPDLSEIQGIEGILKTTVLQAFLSTTLSGILGIAGAFVYSESSSRASKLPWLLSSVCFSLPTLIVALSFAGFWGRSGWLGGVLNSYFSFGFYGWFAVVSAHVFLNHALFLRTVGLALKQMDRTEEMAALSLGASRFRCFREITFPKLIPAVKSSFLLSFAYCSSSFLIVLLLGGGISFTTLEVAIYESLKINFEVSRALWLAFIQLGLGITVFFLATRKRAVEFRSQNLKPVLYYFQRPSLRLLFAAVFSTVYFLFVLGPLLYIFIDGLRGAWGLEWEAVAVAVRKSLALALCVGILVVSIAVGAAYCVRFSNSRLLKRAVELFSMFPIFISAIVLSFGVMQAFSGHLRGTLIGPFLVQSIFCIPIAVRMLCDAFSEIPDSLVFAARSLGANAWQRFTLVEFPLLRRHILSVFLLSVTFSLGEVSSLLMFSAEGTQTLPVLMLHWMNRYQFREASTVACLLLVLVVCVSFFVENRKDLDAVRSNN